MDIKEMQERIKGLSVSEATQIIEDEQKKVKPYFDYMVELNKIHYELKYPGRAKRLGLT